MKNTPALESEDNLRSTLHRYFKNWHWFFITTVCTVIIAFLYLRYATPMYEVNSSLLIKDKNESSGSTAQNASVNDLEVVKSTQSVDNKIQELQSKTLMERVIKELSLETGYYSQGLLKDAEIYGNSLPFKVVSEKINPAAYTQDVTITFKGNDSFDFKDNNTTGTYKIGQRISRSYGTFHVVAKSSVNNITDPIKVKFRNISILADQLLGNLTVSAANENSDVLNLKFNTAVPEQGANLLNKLIEVANKEEVEDKNTIALNTIKFIDNRLKFLIGDLNNVEKNVESLKQQNSLTDVNSNAQMYLEQSGAYNKQLADADVQLNVLESVESYVKKPGQLVPSALGITDATLSNLITKFNELQLERQRILRTAQPDNPIVININEQLAGLRTNILENLHNIKRGIQITRRNFESNSSQYQAKIKSVPALERELQEIQRQQSVKQNLYLYLLQKREESALALAATVSNARVIDKVNVNPIPISPKKQLVYLCAFLIGIGLPAAGIYTKDLFNNKIEKITDVRALTDVKILGEISHSKVKGHLVVRPESRTTISELFRLIRTNLRFNSDPGNQVILVTSSSSGEGKTFFCSNLGSTLAATDKKVVILEFDLRRPALLDGLAANNGSDAAGITNYITDDRCKIDDIVKPLDGIPNLYVIGAGQQLSNPSELVLSSKVEKMIDELRQKFDYIILDTSPIGQVADALSLAPYTDSSVYVIRYNYTLKSQLNVLNEVSDKLKNPMIVLNDAEVDNYKGYGYGYGYVNNGKKMKLIG